MDGDKRSYLINGEKLLEIMGINSIKDLPLLQNFEDKNFEDKNNEEES